MRWYADMSRRKPDRSTDELDAMADRWLHRKDVDMVVCGHDHVARIIRFGHGEYVNCGAFGADRSAALLTDDGVRLVTWIEQDNILRSATSP